MNEPETIDSPMGRINVDRFGNVLFLDQERLNRKAHPEKPLWRRHPHGLGIKDFIVSRIGARPSTYRLYTWGFPMLIKGAEAFFKKPGIGRRIFRRLVMVGPIQAPTGYTKGVWIPLEVDLSDRVERTRVPWDLLAEQIRNAEFIGGMKSCVCRDSFGCSTYPHDLACLFFGKSGEAVVRTGLAVEVSHEDALARLERAKSVGLNSEALHVELEQFVWGLTNAEMEEFQEVCFCCPCCCVGMKFCKAGTRDIKDRFTASGWTSTVDADACIACGDCGPVCPQECISFDADAIATIDQEHCMGCGFCITACPAEDCIKIKQTMPMRDSIHDYFLTEDRFDVKVR